MKLHMDWTDRVLLIALTILGIANATDSDTSNGWRLGAPSCPPPSPAASSALPAASGAGSVPSARPC